MRYDPIQLVHKIQFLNTLCLEIGTSPNDMYLREFVLDLGVRVSIEYDPGTDIVRKVYLIIDNDGEYNIRFVSSIVRSEFGRTFKLENHSDDFSFEPKCDLEGPTPTYLTYTSTKPRDLKDYDIIPYSNFCDEAWVFQQECIKDELEMHHALFFSYMYDRNVRSFMSDSYSVEMIYDKLQEGLCHL